MWSIERPRAASNRHGAGELSRAPECRQGGQPSTRGLGPSGGGRLVALMQSDQMAHYEVYCHACNVTFPPETKVCLHCGARTQKDPASTAVSIGDLSPISFVDERGAASLRPVETSRISLLNRAKSRGEAGAAIATAAIAQPEYVHPEEAIEEAQEGAGSRSLLRAGMSVLWMIVLAGAYAWRACSG